MLFRSILQCLMLVVVAVILGWSSTDTSWWRLVLAVALGTLAFSGIGLALAGRLRAEVNLAAQNGLYLVLLALGGVMVPSDELPDAMARFARWLPSGALAESLYASVGAVGDTRAWWILVFWAVAAPVVAARLFRFDG